MGNIPTKAGPGRPKGVSEETKLLQKAKRRFNVRAGHMASRLLSSQALIANGTSTLMRIDEIVHYRNDGKVDKQGNETKSRYVERKFVVVTDPEELETVYNDFQDIDGSGIIDGKYYFVTHDKPNNQAIDSILNRVFGKPKETIDLSTTTEVSIVDNKEALDAAIFEYITGNRVITVKAEAPKEESVNALAFLENNNNG